MFDAAVPVARQGLLRAAHLLDQIERTGRAEVLLRARLAPDMFACRDQLASGIGFALRATLPLTGRALPEFGYEANAAGLRKRIGAAEQLVAELRPSDFDDSASRMISHRAGFADLVQSGDEYLRSFAVPNMWFHLALAYAILRAEGVSLGKTDFDGLHKYPVEFSFDR